jgi:PadR family transcriptional regulator, regulatory protein PadR
MAVLLAMLERPDEDHYGLELAKCAGLQSGTIYPLLRRFERTNWVTSTWEDVDASAAGRPPRRLYRLTGEGQAVARAELAQVQKLAAGIRPGLGLT